MPIDARVERRQPALQVACAQRPDVAKCLQSAIEHALQIAWALLETLDGHAEATDYVLRLAKHHLSYLGDLVQSYATQLRNLSKGQLSCIWRFEDDDYQRLKTYFDPDVISQMLDQIDRSVLSADQ